MQKPFTYYISCKAMELIAQELYDYALFNHPNEDRIEMMESIKKSYKSLKGKDIRVKHKINGKLIELI
jgi:hypothetical protein